MRQGDVWAGLGTADFWGARVGSGDIDFVMGGCVALALVLRGLGRVLSGAEGAVDSEREVFEMSSTCGELSA